MGPKRKDMNWADLPVLFICFHTCKKLEQSLVWTYGHGHGNPKVMSAFLDHNLDPYDK